MFISHATEDKEDFVRPLARALVRLGLKVWYDEFSLQVGASLSRAIDKGLAESHFGIVILSPRFFEKKWTEYELRGLVAREIEEDWVILPIWHNVTRNDVVKFCPSLADKIALNTAHLQAGEIAKKLLRQIRPDIHASYSMVELDDVVEEAALELQAELEAIRKKLSKYLCPFCDSAMVSRVSAPTDESEKDWGIRESFRCGFTHFDTFLERPCPSDPRFPKFEDFELHFRNNPKEPRWKWQCHARAKTEMARKLHIERGLGSTKKEAIQQVKTYYDRVAKRLENRKE